MAEAEVAPHMNLTDPMIVQDLACEFRRTVQGQPSGKGKAQHDVHSPALPGSFSFCCLVCRRSGARAGEMIF